MTVCRACNVEVEGKFCGECGGNVEADASAPQHKTIQFCEACNIESDGGKFCGECGGAVTQKEVEVAHGKSTGSGGGLSIFEQNALQQQKSSSASNQVRDHKFAGSKPAAGYCGTFGDEQRKKAQAAVAPTHGVDKWGGKKTSGYVGSFGDDQRKKAQEAASPSKFNKFGGGAQTGYVGSFGDEQRKKAQANQSTGGGYNKFGGGQPMAAGGGMDFVTASNVQNQKIASEANRAGHDIVKSNDKKCEGAIDMATANALEKQKLTNEANRTKDSIVVSKEKASHDGGLSLADSNALHQQKETSQALKRQDNLVKTSTGSGEAPSASGSSAPDVYRCEGCDCERPEGKFCQECGTKLVVV